MAVTAPFAGDMYVSGQPTESETKDWDYLYFMAIRNWMVETRTAFPAEITQILSTSYVNVQPLLQRSYKTKTLPVTLPIVQNVPVIMPGNGTYGIKYPLQIGDVGMCVCSDRSLDAWKISGGTVDPADPRLHNMSDAVFYPGLNPLDDPMIPPPTASVTSDLALFNGQSTAILQAAGTFLFQGAGGTELVNMMIKTLNYIIQTNQNLAQAVTATMLGPEPLANAAAYAQTATDAQATLQLLTALQGS